MTGTVTSNGSGQLQMSIPFLGWTEGGFNYYLTAATSATGPQSAPTAIVGLTTQFDFQTPSLSVSDIGGQLTFTVSGGGTTYDGVQEVGIIFMDVNGSESEGQVIASLPVGGGTFVASDAILHWADANAVPAFTAASYGGWGDPNGPQSTFIPGDTYQGQLSNFVDFPAPPASAPAAPSGLRAQGYANSTGQGIRLIWNDQSDNETGFLVERSTSETGTYSTITTVSADAQTYVDNSSDLQPGQTYWYEVIATGSDGNSAPSAPASGVIPVVPPVVHMQVATIDDNTVTGHLTPAQESTEGAYLPLDDNNWDYNPNGTPDMNQTVPDPVDQFLLPITLRELTGATAADGYTLSSSPGYTIWQHKDKTGLVTSSTFFSADQTTTVYVEGIKEGTFKLSAALNWKGTTSNADSVKLTVFGMNGAMDVPGGDAYGLTNGKGFVYWSNLSTGTWVSADHGRIVYTANTMLGNFAGIDWENQAVVGKAVFQASSDYTWGWGVNVVSIKVDPTASYSGYSFSGTIHENGGSVEIDSKQMQLLTVVDLAGPSILGVEAGVEFIKLGLVQEAQTTANSSIYGTGSTKFGEQYTDVNGKWYNDRDHTADPPPWYDASDTWMQRFPGDDVAALPALTDNPKAVIDGYSVKGSPPITVDYIRDVFRDYLVAQTTQVAVGAFDDRFAVDGEGSWYFDASGTWVSNGIIGVWIRTSRSKDAVVAQMSGNVTDVPQLSGESANDFDSSQHWAKFRPTK